MLTQLSIKNFRGIRDGLFTGFGPINIVVGPNNCGKSSFLEALSLLPTPNIRTDPLGRSVLEMLASRRNEVIFDKPHRRALVTLPATWWFRLNQSEDILFEAETHVDDELPELTISVKLTRQAGAIPQQEHESGVTGHSAEDKLWAHVMNGPGDQGEPARRRTWKALLLDLDMARDRTIEQNIWIDLFKKRRDKYLVTSLNEIYGLSLDALTMGAAGELMFGLPEVGLPIDSLGAGARVSVRLLMGALAAEGSMLMLEEVDAFQSADNLARLARVLLDTCVKEDVQLFLTTHRRQTIDAFLDAGRKASVDVRVLPLVTGKDGLVRARGIGRADAAALTDAGEDLREIHRSLQAE